MPGTWTREEVDWTIPVYFEMFRRQLRGEDFVKAEYQRHLIPDLDDRSEGAVEYKFQNISAVLRELGYPHMDGYAPLSNYQELLRERVIEFLERDTELQSVLDEHAQSTPELSEEEIPSFEDRLEEPPENQMESENIGPEAEDHSRTARKINYVERERRNRRLGKRGEEFVVSLEKKRLQEAGKPNLADQVEWVAETEGDGLGYDILSYDEDGQERYIEVKTTNQSKQLPFYLTAREVQFSKEAGSQFYIYRVYNFDDSEARAFFTLNGSVSESCDLTPKSYRADPGNL